MTAHTRAAAPPRRTVAPARKPAAPRKRKAPKKGGRPRRKTSASATKSRGGRPLKYFTPQFMAEAQRRVEQTLESTTSIAGKLGIHHSVLSRLIRREGWVRPEGSLRRRDLSPVMRLAAATDALAMASAERAPRPNTLAASGEAGRSESDAPAPHDLSAIDRLEQAVLRELATVEAMRASLGSEPLRPMDAERTARTLSILTETLSKLRRLRLAAAPQAGPNDDDLPADIDAFRIDLARRIDAFVASRTEPADADGDPRPAPVDEVR